MISVAHEGLKAAIARIRGGAMEGRPSEQVEIQPLFLQNYGEFLSRDAFPWLACMPHIVIEVPDPSNAICVAIQCGGHDGQCARLRQDLADAGHYCGLAVKCFRCELRGGTRDSLSELAREISDSRIFAAVYCASLNEIDGLGGVNYQVGFAHARGKVVILIVQEGYSPHLFPATFERLFFRPADLGTSSFASRLRRFIAVASKRVDPTGLVSTHYLPFTWASLHHSWLNNPTFIEDFRDTIQAAQNATRVLQQITHSEIDSLLQMVDRMVALNRIAAIDAASQSARTACGNEFKAKWQAHEGAFNAVYRHQLVDASRLAASVSEKTIDSLRSHALAESLNILGKCQQRAKLLSRSIDEYVTQYTAITNFLKESWDTVIFQPDITSALSGKLTKLSKDGKDIMIIAVALQKSLLELPL